MTNAENPFITSQRLSASSLLPFIVDVEKTDVGNHYVKRSIFQQSIQYMYYVDIYVCAILHVQLCPHFDFVNVSTVNCMASTSKILLFHFRKLYTQCVRWYPFYIYHTQVQYSVLITTCNTWNVSYTFPRLNIVSTSEYFRNAIKHSKKNRSSNICLTYIIVSARYIRYVIFMSTTLAAILKRKWFLIA